MAKARKPAERDRAFATNRKARRDYEIVETYEVGLVLSGTEIKSIRQHKVSLDDSFARIEDGELFLYNMYVNPYEQGGRYNLKPDRPRKLLMHRRQIARLIGLLKQQRATLVPLRLYQQHGFAKVELAVGKGKRVFDKRDQIRKRESKRQIDRALRRDQR